MTCLCLASTPDGLRTFNVRLQRSIKLGVLAHAIAVAADVHQMAMMQNSVDEGGGHHLVAKDLAPFLEALVGREHGRRAFVAAVHELEEQHSTAMVDRQVADLINHQ